MSTNHRVKFRLSKQRKKPPTLDSSSDPNLYFRSHPQKWEVHPDTQRRSSKSRRSWRPWWWLGIQISHLSGFLLWCHHWSNTRSHPKATQSLTSRATHPVRNVWRVWDSLQRKTGRGLWWSLRCDVKGNILGFTHLTVHYMLNHLDEKCLALTIPENW